jgi:hypothetical protein
VTIPSRRGAQGARCVDASAAGVALAAAAVGAVLLAEIWRRALRGAGRITVVRMDASTMTLRGIHPAARPE